MSLFDFLKSRKATEEDTAAIDARRKALHALTMGTAGALVALAVTGGKSEAKEAQPAAAPIPEPHGGKEKSKHKWGMAIDMDSCTGCGGCVVACAVENNVPMQEEALSDQARGIFWMDLLNTSEGKYPEAELEVMPVPCMHCDDPPCVKVCPVNATYLSEEGIVAQIFDRCIGCRYCMSACPYGRRYFNFTEPSWKPAELQGLNPDVSTRPAGVVEKCTFCHQRVRAAKEKARADETPLLDKDLKHLTACSQACPARAITFGDLNDPESTVSKLHKSPRAIRLLEELGCKPKVVYLRETKWRE